MLSIIFVIYFMFVLFVINIRLYFSFVKQNNYIFTFVLKILRIKVDLDLRDYYYK